MTQNTRGIQKYRTELLPEESGESILVEDIGSASLGDDYKVEKKLNYFEITRKDKRG